MILPTYHFVKYHFAKVLFSKKYFAKVSCCQSTVLQKKTIVPKYCLAKDNQVAKEVFCKRNSFLQSTLLQKIISLPKYHLPKYCFAKKKPKYRVAKSSWPKYQFAKLYGFVKVSFCPNAILPKYHFGNMSFCQNIVMPKQHIAEFCQVSACLHNDGPKSSQHDNLGRPFAN